MRFYICITTIDAVDSLKECLEAIWHSSIKPHCVVVSDDSSAPEIQKQNQDLVKQYLHTNYVVGSHAGVCANRNSALRRLTSLTKTDLIAFIDDDIVIDRDFIKNALAIYQNLTSEREKTFLTGGMPTKLSFRGYFSPSDLPLCVNLHTAVFTAAFFKTEKWDENIFFGYEDALLCLRAIKHGYRILHCPELKTTDTRVAKSSLTLKKIGKLTEYHLYIEAGRLYVGIQRYKNINPNPIKLRLFLIIYYIHMTIYLIKNRALRGWLKINYYSKSKHFLK
ncbi:MAG TPA: glycosyltransferase [Coleofasciculaceae cyanobacterium]|jgi:glycosyltransferase involved in cell wall biosynthesis